MRRIFATKTQARMALDAVRGQIVEGRYVDKKEEVKTPLEEACKRFLKWSKVNTRPSSHSHDEDYTGFWQVSPHFQGKTLDKITPADVEGYKISRLGSRTSKKTVDNDLGRLRRMFNLSRTWGLCDNNPVEKVKFFRPESRRDRFLSPEEEAVLLEKASPPLRSATIFALNTGLRRMELLTLTWAQVDMKQGFVTVTAEVAKGKRTRRVPLNATAKAILKALPRPINQEALVFSAFHGRDDGSFRKSWNRAVKAAKLQNFRWHDLRHTFASRLVMAGVDLVTVQKLLGHTTLTMVLRYSHLSETHVRDAVTRLDSNPQKTSNGPEAVEKFQ